MMGIARPGDPGFVKTGWSKSGNLWVGNMQLAPGGAPVVGPFLQAPSAQVQMQADFPYAGEYTVQFDIQNQSQQPYPPGFLSQQTQATIRWTGVEGNSVRRRISVGNGTSISGAGVAATVIMTDTTSSGLSNTVGAMYGISATISRGTRPNSQLPVTLYEAVFVLPPSMNSAVIQIPQDAGVISIDVECVYAKLGLSGLVTLGGPVTDTAVALLNSTPVTFKIYYPNVDPGFVPVPPNATEVIIYNLNATNYSIATVIWGIDG